MTSFTAWVWNEPTSLRSVCIPEIALAARWEWTGSLKVRLLHFPTRVLRSTMKFQSWFATKPSFSILMNNLEPHWISLLPSSGFCSLPFFMIVPAFQDPIYVSEFPVERDSLAEAGGFIFVLFFQPTFLLMTSNFLVSVKIVRPPRSIFHTLHHSISLQVSKKISCHLEKKKKLSVILCFLLP